MDGHEETAVEKKKQKKNKNESCPSQKTNKTSIKEVRAEKTLSTLQRSGETEDN